MDQNGEEPLPHALLVDDEKEVADAYALRLRGLCEVETVYSGDSALQRVRERDIDIMLLDRHMPGTSGDDVLTELAEMGYAGRVIMVTAIDPGFDVLDMPFDDYLCKPVGRDDIREAVRQQQHILGYETLGEYFSVESKRTVIEAELPDGQREDHEGYQQATERASRLRARTARLLDDPNSLFDAFDGIEREGR